MNYYNEIKNLIEEREINKKVRALKDNREDLLARWNIGKLLVEAQGGIKRAKYGTSLIKKWGQDFESKYGYQYGRTNLMYMRQLYLFFQNAHSLRGQLTWTHYRKIITIKDENKRNYYINQVIINNLSSRELEAIIKNKSYERLSYADKKNIKIIEEDNYTLNIEDMIKDPIIINTNKDIDNMNEKVLHKYIINMLEEKFMELGTGFTLAGHEYKIIIDDRAYKIDLLFFNVKLNSYVVVEIKIREIHKEDISQLQFYVNYIDKNIKEKYMNKTIGILIVKKNNKLVIEYTTNDDIYVTTYKITNKKT